MGAAGVIAVLAGLAGAALHAANAAMERAPSPSFWLMGFAAAVAFGTMATLLRRSPAIWLRRVMAAIGLAQGLSLLCQEWAWAAPGAPLAGWALWLGSWLWAPAYVAVIAVLPQLLPGGRVLSRRWRPALLLGLGAVVLVSVGWALTPYALQDYPGALPAGFTNPVGTALAAHRAVTGVSIAVLVTAVVVSIASLVARWRRSAGIERQQLKWAALGYGATVALVVVSQLMPLGLAETLAALAMLPVPVATAVAALRHGLWGVDLVLSRSIVYALLAVLMAAVFTVASRVLELLTGESAPPVLAAVVAALALLPLHAWLQRLVNRAVHGGIEEPHAALARLGRRLEAASAPDEIVERVLPSVVEQVARALRAGHARLVLSDGTEAAHGDSADADRSPQANVELDYAGTRVGRMALWRPGGFGPGELALLARLADQAAVAAHTVLLANQAQAAREAAVLAREEERRRLRRDLHDDIGPSLAALALQADAARELAVRDPASSLALLDRLVPRLNGTVESVRALVHELRPPMLDELGLGPALRELAASLSTPATQVRARITDLPELPAAVEVAAYRIAGEAVANAVRHAGAAEVTLSVAVTDGRLLLEVGDDGRGLPERPAEVRGVGLPSMRLRAEELGGTLRVAWAGSGTRVTATLPTQALDEGGDRP